MNKAYCSGTIAIWRETLEKCVNEMEYVATELDRPTQPMIADPYGYYARMIRKRLCSAKELLR